MRISFDRIKVKDRTVARWKLIDQFQQVMSSLAKVPGAGEEQQTQQLRELLSAIEELHLCLEPLEAPCSDLVARLP